MDVITGIGLGKKCDGRKMPGQKDPSSGKNKFHIISFFRPSIFLPLAETECQRKDELNPKRLLEGCSLFLIAAIETQATLDRGNSLVPLH